MHLLVEALSHKNITSTRVLPFNTEKYRRIEFNIFELSDTFHFLNTGLAKLADSLHESGTHSYGILSQSSIFKGKQNKDKLVELVSVGKSFFPYEFCTSISKMKKTKKLPKRKYFYSAMSEESITKEQHMYAKRVWRKFGCGNLLEYASVYCNIDTFLLAEVKIK